MPWNAEQTHIYFTSAYRQVLGAMTTRLPSRGPWFSWMGGPQLKETPHLGIWDAAARLRDCLRARARNQILLSRGLFAVCQPSSRALRSAPLRLHSEARAL